MTESSELLDIRPISPADAASVAALTGELGYPCDVEVMRARIEHLAALPEHRVLVATRGSQVVGWVHVSEVCHLQADPRAEIGGLVVTADARSGGIGARLVACAEQWARDRRLTSVVVRSQAMREDAHRFYLREGYERTKTSAVFSKRL